MVHEVCGLVSSVGNRALEMFDAVSLISQTTWI